MKTIIVKVNNATQTIAEHTVVTQDGKPTVIKQCKNVNYELFDPSYWPVRLIILLPNV